MIVSSVWTSRIKGAFPLFSSLFAILSLHECIVMWSPFFHLKIVQANRGSFQRNLIFALINLSKRGLSGWIIALYVFWHAERSCLAGCPSLRGMVSPSTGADLLTPRCWVSRWNKDETRNQARCKIVTRSTTLFSAEREFFFRSAEIWVHSGWIYFNSGNF